MLLLLLLRLHVLLAVLGTRACRLTHSRRKQQELEEGGELWGYIARGATKSSGVG